MTGAYPSGVTDARRATASSRECSSLMPAIARTITRPAST